MVEKLFKHLDKQLDKDGIVASGKMIDASYVEAPRQRNSVHDVLNYSLSKDGRTVIPINLPENESVFIVFSKKKAVNHIIAIEGSDHVEIVKDSNRTATLTTWKGGDYILTDVESKRQTISHMIPLH